MTIYFNPHYDSSVFLTASDCGLGKIFSGREALLSELELRAGLTCADIGNEERVIAYMEAMQKALDKAISNGDSIFYSESFERDDFSTAELMLSWRDALVKIGWNGEPVCSSHKIQVLSQIETFFHCHGSADRWRDILKEAARRPILRPSDKIIVECPKDALEPVLVRLFDAINAHYETPVVEFHSLMTPIKDGKEFTSRCRILDFNNEYSAHEWIASQNLGEKDVVAEADGALLGDILHTLGKPGIGAADEGIGAVMRLLPVGLSLFRYPADITSLQSYLQSPRTPLEKLHTKQKKEDGTPFYRSAARQLFEHICSEGGFGSEWNDILSDAIYDREGTELKEKVYKDSLSFIDMWNQSKSLPAGEAPVSGVKSFIMGLDNWAGVNVNPESKLNPQFMALQRGCSAILRLLEGWRGETIPVERLCRWASHICTPIDISTDYARQGSMNVIRNLADIHSPAEHLVWFASTTDNSIPFQYDFLSRSEIKALNETGIPVPDKEQAARSEKELKLEGLCRCTDITIVTCRRISGVETTRSALLSEIASCIPSIEGDSIKKSASGDVETDHGKATVHHFDPKILEGFHREAESYSSINTLLMSPVDYLLDYVKKYRQYGTEEVADVQTTEGNVSHAYIEALGQKCSYDPEAMMRMHKDRFDAILDEVISEKGLILCLEKNRLEEKSYRVGLRESVEIFLGIIIENCLTIEGFEYELTAQTENIGPVYAKIDCLLKDPKDGKYVIIDFKYNSGKTYFRTIEENRELQLAVYRKVIEKGGFRLDADGNKIDIPAGEVKFIGYYAIPRKTLYTPKNTLSNNTAIEEVEHNDSRDIFDMAAKGYVFRWEQLRGGILEEGEGLKLADLNYAAQQNLYPLEHDYDRQDLKAKAYGDKNITLKGGLK